MSSKINQATNTCKFTKTSVSKPWFDTELKRSIHTKNHWYAKHLKNPNNELVTAELRYWRNKTTFMRRQKRSNYYADKFENSAGNIKKTWQNIKSVLYNGIEPKNKIEIPDKNMPDYKEQWITDLNKYYVNIAKNTNNEPNLTVYHQTSDNQHQLNLTTTDENYIRKIIQTAKNSSSSGFDKIPIRIIKDNVDQLVKPITTIINKSITTALVPKSMKISKIVPIFKNGNK